MGFIHDVEPSQVVVNKTSPLMNETVPVVFRTANVSMVSPTFLVCYDRHFMSGGGGKYTVKVSLNSSKYLHFYYDVHRTIEWSYSVSQLLRWEPQRSSPSSA